MQQMKRLGGHEADQQQADIAALSGLKLPTVTTKKAEVLVKQLRKRHQGYHPVSANILRSWLTENGASSR